MGLQRGEYPGLGLGTETGQLTKSPVLRGAVELLGGMDVQIVVQCMDPLGAQARQPQ